MNKRVVVTLVVLFSALSYLFISAFLDNKMAYSSVSEIVINLTDFNKKFIKVTGALKIDSITQQKGEAGKIFHQFTIEDKKDKTQMIVHFNGVMPGNLIEETDVILTGMIDNSILKADTMITKCPSKYENEKKHPDSIKK